MRRVLPRCNVCHQKWHQGDVNHTVSRITFRQRLTFQNTDIFTNCSATYFGNLSRLPTVLCMVDIWVSMKLRILMEAKSGVGKNNPTSQTKAHLSTLLGLSRYFFCCVDSCSVVHCKTSKILSQQSSSVNDNQNDREFLRNGSSGVITKTSRLFGTNGAFRNFCDTKTGLVSRVKLMAVHSPHLHIPTWFSSDDDRFQLR